jgi:putative flippase GtrA
MAVLRQFASYASVGVVATLAHYAVLLALVEGLGWRPVPATLHGYAVGGVVSYLLNRRHTFASARPHSEAGWRFALVAFAGFCVTFATMRLLVDIRGAPYLPAQVVTTALVMFLTFFINKAWTFG